MRILFVNPPLKGWRYSRSQRSPGVIRSGTLYYPYWLAYAAGWAEQSGHDIDLIDCPADGLTVDDIVAQARTHGAGLIVFETTTGSFSADLETVSAVKLALPDSRTVLVGTHATADWQNALQRCPALDFVAIGEYDVTVADLASRLEAGQPPEEVLGLGLRSDGVLHRTLDRPLIHDMDALPWASKIYKRFLKTPNYLFTIASHPMVMIISGRGCRARCFYCVYPQVMHGHTYRTRSPADVVAEMKWIQENMPEVKEIVFEDDTFTFDRERAREIAGLVREQGVRLPWFANIRVNVDRETLAALRQAGLRQCAAGFESGSDLLLRNMRKGQTLQQQQQFMKTCRELGILVHGCFMVGFPGETAETLDQTLKLALQLEPDSAQFYPVMPYPGTGAYAWAKENGHLATDNFDDWLNENGEHRCVIDLPTLSAADLEAFCEQATRSFHLRPRYIARKLAQAVTRPREGIRSIGAGRNFLAKLLRGLQQPAPARLPARHAAAEMPDAWLQPQRVPRGRMETAGDAGR